MNILVIGAQGSGKTTLVNYAIKQGKVNYIDTDYVEGLNEWRNYQTGEVLGYVGEVGSMDPKIEKNWHKLYGWYWEPSKLDEILSGRNNSIICGSADNAMEFYDKFDKIVLIYKAKEDLARNLFNLNSNQLSVKDLDQFNRYLCWQDRLLETTKPFNPTIIKDNNVEVIFEKVSKLIVD